VYSARMWVLNQIHFKPKSGVWCLSSLNFCVQAAKYSNSEMGEVLGINRPLHNHTINFKAKNEFKSLLTII